MMVALPLGVRTAEVIADRLEARRGPSTATRLLRQSSNLGRRVAHSGPLRGDRAIKSS